MEPATTNTKETPAASRARRLEFAWENYFRIQATGSRAEHEEALREVQRAAAEHAKQSHEEARAVHRETWKDWTPEHAKHVIGRWTTRTFDDSGMPEEQRVECVCSWPGCGAVWKGSCSSGRVKEHVARFAHVHLHRNPLTGEAE